jgi:PAS domain-containing protein
MAINTPDGVRCLEIAASPLPPARDGEADILLFFQDVSARKAAEHELRRANQDSEQLLSSIGSFLIRLDGTKPLPVEQGRGRNAGLGAHQAVGARFSDLDLNWDWGPVRDAVAVCSRRACPCA